VIARVASVITACLGVVTGAFVLFGPTYTRCSFGTIGQTGIGQPVVTLAPARCETFSLVESQPVWPMPLLALAVWSFVPLLGVVGVWSGRPWLVAFALIVEASSIISFGVGPYYVPFVAVPLALTWALARRTQRRRVAPS
jgi:hypothetical protein